ncbi:unnamed protein product [Calypogeia fissa]
MATVEVVEARAPGKVIISGEHAVVHGTPAVAAALDRYTTVRIKRPPAVIGDNGVLSVDLPEVKLRLSWPMQYIKQSLDFPWTETDALETKQIESMKAILEDFVKREVPANADKPARAGVVAFLFLYVSIVGLQPLEVTVTSELPVGSGLGSSAAFCVAAAGALLALVGKVELQADKLKRKWMDLDDKGRNQVNTWAFEAEKIIHGRPSGVDNTVSCYGHVVRFMKGHLTRLRSPKQLRMLITNTKVSRNTKALVAGVGERAVRHPTAMAAVFQAIEAISEEIVSILESPTSDESKLEEYVAGAEPIAPVHPDKIVINGSEVNGNKGQTPIPNSLQALSRLEELMVMNQGLLQCMGVSHPSIDEICQTTSRFHLCSKLTGAGGGGCVLTLLPSGTSPTIVQNVETQLELAGYHCFEAGIGGTGVQVTHSSSPSQDS